MTTEEYDVDLSCVDWKVTAESLQREVNRLECAVRSVRDRIVSGEITEVGIEHELTAVLDEGATA